MADWMPRAATAPPMPQLTLPAPQEPIPDTPPPRPRQVAPSRPPTGGTMPMEVGTPSSTSTTTQAAATPGTSRTLIPSTSPIQQGPDPGLSTCVTDVSGSSSRSGRSGARGRAQGGRGRGGHEREQQRRGRGSGPPVVRPEAMVRGRGDRVGARAEARARQLSAGSGTCPGRCVATAERSGGPVGN